MMKGKCCSIYFTLIENINFGFLWNTSNGLHNVEDELQFRTICWS